MQINANQCAYNSDMNTNIQEFQVGTLNLRPSNHDFPSPVLVFVINLGLARKSSPALSHNFVAQLAGTSPLPNSNHGTPGP